MYIIVLNIADITIQIQSEIKGVIDRFKEFYKHFIITINTDSLDYIIEIMISDFDVNIVENKNETKKNNFNYQGYAYKQNKENNKSILIIQSVKNAFQYTEEFLLFIFSELCMKKSKLIFHSATLFDVDFNCYIFFGPSGIGKSTLSKKMTSLSVFSDDMVVIKKTKRGFKLYKTPFERNKTKKSPLNVDIKGFYRLVQTDKSNKVLLSSGKGITALLSNFWFNKYSKINFYKYIIKAKELFDDIPVYELHLDKETKENEIIIILKNK